MIKRKTFGIKRKRKKRRAITENGEKLWSLKKADIEYRTYRLGKDGDRVVCVFPGCNICDPAKLTLSHYHGRAKKGTRYHDDNLDWLCRNHHYWDKQRGWEFQKQTLTEHGWDGRYTLYMKQKLGEDGFAALHELAHSKCSPRAAIQAFQASLKTPQEENRV